MRDVGCELLHATGATSPSDPAWNDAAMLPRGALEQLAFAALFKVR
jgi:hypothetical protein